MRKLLAVRISTEEQEMRSLAMNQSKVSAAHDFVCVGGENDVKYFTF